MRYPEAIFFIIRITFSRPGIIVSPFLFFFSFFLFFFFFFFFSLLNSPVRWQFFAGAGGGCIRNEWWTVLAVSVTSPVEALLALPGLGSARISVDGKERYRLCASGL